MTHPLVKGRHAGVLTPLFSMPSARSWGIGELPDVVPMAEWLRAAGLDLLQLLPMGEMTSGQCSPYSALSAMALDPIFISLTDLEEFGELGGEAALDPADRAELAHLRATASVDYEAVRRLTASASRTAYRRFRARESRRRSTRRRDFEAYCEAHAWWLDDYALFRALHAHHSELPWTSWPEELRSRDAKALARAREDLAEEILFIEYLQWILDTQWRRARERARPVAMIGDVSFTVSWDSSDVWAHQGCFDLSATVGAPPDAFSAAGQDWGLPAYRWEALRALDYRWLRQRARRTADLYDACRIDHIVGFYRTYVRPGDGRAPYFAPTEVPEQLALGEDILRIFVAAGMRILAEDLGTVPDFVRASLARHGVPGYRVLRWERAWETAGQPYLDPTAYPSASVATSGTHDVESLADWWDALSVEERRQVCRIPALQDVTEPLVGSEFGAEIRDAMLRALFASGSDFVVLPIQDVFGWRGQINRPGVPSDENWTYRLPWPSDRLGLEPEAIDRARVLRAWSEEFVRGAADRGRSDT
jgi:4-alpha-glucanotransferase